MGTFPTHFFPDSVYLNILHGFYTDMQYERETAFLEKISVKGYKKLKTDLVLIYIRVMLIGVQVEQHK